MRLPYLHEHKDDDPVSVAVCPACLMEGKGEDDGDDAPG